jgi:hypothetical protein
MEIPLEDGVLTENQVTRSMAAMTTVAMEEREHLRTLLNTGVYPSSEDPRFQEALEKLLGREEAPELPDILEAPEDETDREEETVPEEIDEIDDVDFSHLLEELDFKSDES